VIQKEFYNLKGEGRLEAKKEFFKHVFVVVVSYVIYLLIEVT
jgi:hypothetical protein